MALSLIRNELHANPNGKWNQVLKNMEHSIIAPKMMMNHIYSLSAKEHTPIQLSHKNMDSLFIRMYKKNMLNPTQQAPTNSHITIQETLYMRGISGIEEV